MCDQCVAGTREVCQPIKGWKLVRALNDGLWTIRGDDYGLVDLDIDQDVDIVIPVEVTPRLPAMTWGEFTNRDREASDLDEDDLMERIANFAATVQQWSRLDALADLVSASRSDGWDPENDGDFSWWLYTRLAHALANNR